MIRCTAKLILADQLEGKDTILIDLMDNELVAVKKGSAV